ncbi:DOPA 4,5-dioxygenase family protein [Massilia sp. W12]|uniref:DOPA 4,5-dioxygenase family protein n=1 Tax=Massilia sp. W12 TaxID=3126507 RepID=UPI0030CFFD10
MLDPIRPLADIFHYHIHIYFDAASQAKACALREAIGARFKVQLGRVFDKPVGPHPLPQYEIGVLQEEFGALLGWLMLNHQGLSILAHPNTDLERHDHSSSAFWLGQPVQLDFQRTAPSLRAIGQDAPRPVLLDSQPHLPA